MQKFPWLPLGYEVHPGVKSGRLIAEGFGYQIVAQHRGSGCVLLIETEALPASPALTRLEERSDRIDFGIKKLQAAVFGEDGRPVRLGDMHQRSSMTSLELSGLLKALRGMERETPGASWEEALHLPSESECIPIKIVPDSLSHRAIAARIMTGGVSDQKLSARQIKNFTPWLTLAEVEEFLALCGDAPRSQVPGQVIAPFLLVGQPEFTRIINEYVVEFQRHPDRFAAMRVRMPNAVLLHGPTGTGKTFALKKLSEHLRWTTIEASLGTVGSAFLHHTSHRLRALFEEAEAKRPVLLILNEVDALTSERTGNTADFRVEETNELLALVESASARGILVAGTTNRIEAIDPAFLRKGRFDLQMKMGYPELEQIEAMLAALLNERPHVAGLNLERVMRELRGRPPSDIDWLVNEAARLAAHAGKDAIDDICLFNALGRLDKRSGR